MCLANPFRIVDGFSKPIERRPLAFKECSETPPHLVEGHVHRVFSQLGAPVEWWREEHISVQTNRNKRYFRCQKAKTHTTHHKMIRPVRHKIWAPHVSMDHKNQEPAQLTVAWSHEHGFPRKEIAHSRPRFPSSANGCPITMNWQRQHLGQISANKFLVGFELWRTFAEFIKMHIRIHIWGWESSQTQTHIRITCRKKTRRHKKF